MLPDLIEMIAQERQQALLQAVEQRRLLALVAPESSGETTTWRMRCWLGTQMVSLGLKLQGYSVASLPQLSKQEPCNS